LTCKRCVAYCEHIVINIAQTLTELGGRCAGTWTLHLFCNLHSSILFLFLRMRMQFLCLQMGSLPKRHSQTAGMTAQMFSFWQVVGEVTNTMFCHVLSCTTFFSSSMRKCQPIVSTVGDYSTNVQTLVIPVMNLSFCYWYQNVKEVFPALCTWQGWSLEY